MAWLAAGLLALAGCGSGSGRSGTDVRVSGTGPAETVQSGSQAVFEMVVTNAGDYAAEDLRITNEVGGQLALLSITCAAEGGAVCPEAPSVAMAVPSLREGGTLRFTVTTQANPAARGTIFNRMSASFAYETDSDDNIATVTATAFSPASNLVVSGSGPAGTVTGGSSFDFQMQVRNEGPDAATGVRIVNDGGTALVIDGITCAASGGAACPAAPAASMDIGTIPAGGALDFTVSATVANGINGTVTNTMQATADADSNRGDNAFTAQATVVTPQAGVFVTGTGPAGTVAGGGTATFAMTVSNAGPDAATGINIVNAVGSNLTFVDVRCTASGGGTCPAALGPVMAVPTLPAGGALRFDVDAVVANGTSGLLTNTLTANASNDPDRSDNSATAVATANTPRASLALSGTGPADTVAGGTLATFEMRVVNNGPDPATGLRVLNTVGSNLSFVSATCSASGGGVCPGSVGVLTDVGTLAVGGQLTFSVNALVAAGANGSISNTMQATADNVFSVGGNSVVAVGTAFSARSSLAVSGTGPAAAVPSGGSATFRMTVSNAGPDVASAVRLVNALSGNLTLTGITCAAASGGAVCPASTGAQMDIASLPVGGSLAFDVTASVAAGTQGSILSTMTASVVAGGTRTETSGVAVGSAYAVSVAVSGSGPAGPLAGGATGEFLMDVTNGGPGTALDLVLANTLSAGLDARGAIVCVQAVGATCPAITGGSITVAALPAGASLRFSVPFTVTAGTNATVGNTMTATVAGDARVADNSATVTFTAASIDVGVSQVAAAQVDAGATATFTAVVANPGSQAANNLVITHALSGAGAAGLAATITCTPSVAATCPATGPTMTLASLAARSTLTFTITVPTLAGTRGAITSTLAVTSDGDPNAGNNSAASTTTATDPRNGTYKAIAANGNVYDLALDFDAASYTMAGAGNAQAFGAPVGSEYTVGGAVRFRVAEDLIVGGHDFGGGVLPYVAVRRFETSVADIAGQYTLVIRDVPAAGDATTRAAVAQITGNQMAVCIQDTASAPAPGTRCNPANQVTYVVAVSGGVFAAFDNSGAQVFRFFVARSGASRLIVGANAVGTTGDTQMRIGLQSQTSLLGGTLGGPSSSGNWIGTMTLSPSLYEVSGAGSDDNLATLGPHANPETVGSLRTGLLTTGGDRLWVMQSAPLAVAFGSVGAAGAGKGLLQIVLAP